MHLFFIQEVVFQGEYVPLPVPGVQAVREYKDAKNKLNPFPGLAGSAISGVWKYTVVFSLSMLVLSACNKDDLQNMTFDEIVSSGGVFQEPLKEEQVLSSLTTTEEKDGVTWECTRKTMSIKAGAGGNEGFPLFSPNSSVVYPGNMLQGNSLNDATPKIIAIRRAGGKISSREFGYCSFQF